MGKSLPRARQASSRSLGRYPLARSMPCGVPPGLSTLKAQPEYLPVGGADARGKPQPCPALRGPSSKRRFLTHQGSCELQLFPASALKHQSAWSVRITTLPFARAREALVGSDTEFVLRTRNSGSAAKTKTSPDWLGA